MDDAYANAAYIADGDSYPDMWAQQAAAFRASAMAELDLPYGETPRQSFDLFHPRRLAKGVVIFVHGGYWLRFDKSYWSHLAAGPLAHGWAVAMPSYDLCPAVTIPQIGAQIRSAIDAIAARVIGPVRLVGHSAGGQLVARHARHRRVVSTVAVSPVADLAPLMQTTMNADLRIDPATVMSESPVHLPPPATEATVWVGADERPAFIAQAKALGAAWEVPVMIREGLHHFDIIAGLADPDSALTRRVVGAD